MDLARNIPLIAASDGQLAENLGALDLKLSAEQMSVEHGGTNWARPKLSSPSKHLLLILVPPTTIGL
jgi:hypothetical protein